MQRKETAIEVKVGALVLVSLALFAGFVLVLGDFRFGEGFTMYVDFDNAAGLKPGAEVRIAGIPAGKIKNIEFLGGRWDPEVERNVYVRVTLVVDAEMREAVGEGAEYVITTLGVLGEPYIEIVNSTPPGDPVEQGSVFAGSNPPRIDQVVDAAYSGLQDLASLIQTVDVFFQESDLERLLHEAANLAEELDHLVARNADDVSGSMANINVILEESRDRIGPIMTNVEGATSEFEEVGRALNRALNGGSAIRSAIRSLDDILDQLAQHAPETFSDLESTLDSVERIVADREEEISETLANVETISENLVVVSADTAEIVDQINSGRGSIGALLRDDEIYDDFREFVRELKRRPWRLLWRE